MESADNPFVHIRHSLHELAQPLAAVTGLVDLLLLEIDQDNAMFHEIQMISQQLEKVLEIIGEIRRIAREASETLALEPPPAL
jgi:signal transduction histidine kinase